MQHRIKQKWVLNPCKLSPSFDLKLKYLSKSTDRELVQSFRNLVPIPPGDQRSHCIPPFASYSVQSIFNAVSPGRVQEIETLCEPEPEYEWDIQHKHSLQFCKVPPNRYIFFFFGQTWQVIGENWNEKLNLSLMQSPVFIFLPKKDKSQLWFLHWKATHAQRFLLCNFSFVQCSHAASSVKQKPIWTYD